jgi:hypothetical protein
MRYFLMQVDPVAMAFILAFIDGDDQLGGSCWKAVGLWKVPAHNQ